ncbi:acyl carrier protein [Photorhabdus tasmaniensis]|uniref:acyl carrier protein n=1 Tax=Photorhabdus tasmaniensis TaxID=1004159 RepID=UPI0040410A91
MDKGRVIEEYLNCASNHERKEYLGNYLTSTLSSKFKVDINDKEGGLFELGLTSINSIKLVSLFERELDMKLNSSLLFNYPSVNKLLDYFFLSLNEKYSSSGCEASLLENELYSHEESTEEYVKKMLSERFGI